MAVVMEGRQAAPLAESLEVRFTVTAETPPGACVRLVGSLGELGAWNPEDGVELQTSVEAYPRWSAVARLPADAVARGAVEYKFVVAQPGESAMWEEGPNRQLRSEAPASHVFGQQHPDGQEERRAAASPRRPRGGCKVIFEAECPGTLPGDRLLAVGAAEALGAWEPARALRLTTVPTMFPRWCGAATLPAGQPLGAWKLVVLREGGLLDWEPGQDRETLLPPTGSDEVLIVRVHFGASAEESPRMAEAATFSDLSSIHDCLQLCSPGSSSSGTKVAQKQKEELLKAGQRKRFSRPSSTASTASTCTSEEDRDFHELFPEARPFSDEVFEGLFDENLRHHLFGQVAPSVPAHESGENARPLWLWSGAHRVQKPCGRCEDAFFHTSHALGVADGVGSMVQFAKYGADAAAYAAELMQSAAAALAAGGAAAGRTEEGPDARAVAAVAAAEEQAQSYGASTIAVLALEGDKVGVANLGDSGFMLLRKAPEGVAIAARTREQQHGWNCPFQLVRLPPALAARLPKGAAAVVDSAEDCQRYVLEVKPGDLLLLYTDGMCDNLHDREILQIANRALAPALGDLAGLAGFATPPERVARALALAAQERSLDEGAAVPFWEAARRQGMDTGLGGKPDDITVVAAWVMPEDTATKRRRDHLSNILDRLPAAIGKLPDAPRHRAEADLKAADAAKAARRRCRTAAERAAAAAADTADRT